MMTKEEMQSLEWVVNYVMESEQNSYDSWVSEGHTPNRHIYYHANRLDDYIKGLHSTGSVPNGI